jgi:O-antigen/teichoic acid export membrane protein
MGRGIFYFFTETVFSLLCSYGIHIGLGRILGPSQYGIFGVILSISAVSYVFFNYGINKTISKYTAENNTLAYPILSSGLKLQVFLGILITVCFFIFADIFAEILNDHTLASLIRLSAFVILPMALFSVYLGLLNGKKEFGRTAIASVIYSASKVLFVFIFVLFGFGVKGAVGGYIAAAAAGLLVARGLCNITKIDAKFSLKKILIFSFPIVLFSIATSLLLNVDLLFIKAILQNNKLTGFYAAAANLARPVWLLAGAISGVLLPSVSMSSFNNDIALTKKYINQAMRYTLMLLMPLAFIINGTADGFVQLLYSSKFLASGEPLGILIIGFLIFSLFYICSTFITAIGKPGLSLSFILIVVPIDIVLNLILIPAHQILGAAIATSIAFLIGLLLAGGYILKQYKTLLEFTSFLRISFASIIIYLISIKYHYNGMLLLGEYLFLFLIYFGLLVIFKEINKDELKSIKNSLVNFKNLVLVKSIQD